jgi:hypothetical protein
MDVLVKRKRLDTLCCDLILLEEELAIYKNKYESLKNNFKCLICMDDYVDYIPNCGHVGLCIECKNNLVDKRKCVICKQNIKYIKIFLPYNVEKVDCDIGEILVENSIITDFSGGNFIKNELKTYKNTIKSLEYVNQELVIANESLLNKVKEIQNTKKSLFCEKFYAFMREINNLISELNFFRNHNIENKNKKVEKVEKRNRLCDFKNLNNIFR